MYLRALRLKGFKSFPKVTELLFEPGVGVVIGPNGSGKSNLADAVVWALGEQSPTSLRASSMQDVIFAGSDGRRASGGAEVELTFDNGDGVLPLPTPEVSVMRRVGRDGSSAYFVNRSSCRLSDVIELLAPVGLGRELHSIIGQGKVETFLAGRPEDRRSQIEEAAGLGACKRRRERAELKLREVRRNLERAALLEHEVDAQLGPLRRQANAAEQLRVVDRDLGETRARLLSGEIMELDEELHARRLELAGIEAERGGIEEALAQIVQDRVGLEEDLSRRLEQRERHSQRLLRARALDGRLESGARFTEQRLSLLAEMEQSAVVERARLEDELEARADEPDGDVWPAEEKRLQAELEQAEAVYAEVAGRASASREVFAARDAALSRLAAERESAMATVARLERRQEALAGEEARLGEQIQALSAEAGERAGAERAAETALALARDALLTAASAAQTEARTAADAARAVADLEDRHRAVAGERHALESEVEYLRVALRDLQDVGADVLEVAGQYPGAVSLAGAVSCQPGYERALAAALAQVSGAVAVPGDVDRWSLLEALRAAGIGLVRLLVPVARRHPVVAFPGAAPLVEKVEFGGHDELEDLLAGVFVVDDLRAVPDGFSGLAVTREGAFYRPGEGQMGLAGGVPAALLLERRASLASLTEKLEAVHAHEVREAVGLDLARRRDEDAREALRRTSDAEREARIGAEQAQRDLDAIQSRQRDLEAATSRDRRVLEEVAAERAEALAAAEAARTAAAGALLQAEALRSDRDAAAIEVRRIEGEHEDAMARVTRRRVELEERRAAAQRAAARREVARRRVDVVRARVEEIDRRLGGLPPLRALLTALADRVTVLRERTSHVVEELSAEDGVAPVLDRGELLSLVENEADLRLRLEEKGEGRTSVRVALARLEDRRGELTVSIEGLSVQLDQAGFTPPADEAEADELRERIVRLSRRRERIGPVNPLAETECAELGERAKFLREQRRDLERSVNDLEALIDELNTQVDAEFSQTFAAVQEQFARMVSVLFPGGSGSLKLIHSSVEDEPGGVSVQVKPAKKRGQKLQLLSGGERALVAIAFLMALVLARPSPLYILDEIEAALDDINIGRFVQLLRDYRERTQFIVITHQKRTMEAADVLYGVTMGSDGASQVVSARMAEAEIDREQRARGRHEAARPAGRQA